MLQLNALIGLMAERRDWSDGRECHGRECHGGESDDRESHGGESDGGEVLGGEVLGALILRENECDEAVILRGRIVMRAL